MMSKEREFLKKLRYASLLENDLRKELEEFLAQPEHIEDKFDRVKSNREFYQAGYAEAELKLKPEQEQEPLLAETKIEWYGKGFRQGVNEFAPPKPLTEDVIYALDKEGVVENMDDHQVRYVIRWIRRVEKAHGIGGGE